MELTPTSTSSSNTSGLLLVAMPTSDKRSVSPLIPSPVKKLRGVRLFRAISRHLGGRRSRQRSRSPSTDSDGSSSSDEVRGRGQNNRSDYRSCSRSGGDQHSNSGSDTGSGNSGSDSNSGSDTGSGNSRSDSNSGSDTGSGNSGSDSNSGSDTGSGNSGSDSNSSSGNSAGGQTSTSNNSSSGNVSSESSGHALSIRRVFQSLSLNVRGGQNRKTRAKKTPKKILRAPVSYTYVKGLSGLPTQRVPKGYPCPCVYIPIPLHAAFLGTASLNR